MARTFGFWRTRHGVEFFRHTDGKLCGRNQGETAWEHVVIAGHPAAPTHRVPCERPHPTTSGK